MMTSEEYAKIVAKNLRRVFYESGQSQADVSRILKIPQATLSSWMTGKRCPRMKYIDLLCHYFNVSRAEIMEEEPQHYQEFVKPEERELLPLSASNEKNPVNTAFVEFMPVSTGFNITIFWNK